MVVEQLTNVLQTVFSPELTVFTLGALPISELRGAIPVGLTLFNFSVVKTLVLSISGNILPVIGILYIFDYVVDFLRKNKYLDRFFEWLFARTQKKFNHQYDSYGAFALVLFVAIPFPLTGAWTASLAAYLLGLKKGSSFFYIFCGILIAASVVTALTLGILG